jgi:hypothetical protein
MPLRAEQLLASQILCSMELVEGELIPVLT